MNEQIQEIIKLMNKTQILKNEKLKKKLTNSWKIQKLI